MKILIIKFGALGDVVRTTYILKGLYTKYESAKIDYVLDTHDNNLKVKKI